MTPPPKDELAVERWLMAMVWIHVASMLAMPLVLARFLPGGGVDDPLERVRLIAEHPWLFRLGWLPWQLTALVDFIFAVALVRARYLPKALTVPALVMTLAAIAPDQYAQAMYVTKGVELAQASTAAFLAWEPFIFELTAGWGATAPAEPAARRRRGSSRLFSEGMPMHVLERALLARDGEAIELALHPGSGSAPDAKLSLRRCERALPPEWRECFDSFDAMLAYVVPQNRALSTQPYKGRVTRQEIHLPIELAACVPLDGTVESRAARAFVGDAKPLCFHVPNVSFLFSEERHS